MIELYQVDAFTLVPFAGNPAGVCILDEPRSDAWMVCLAGEMNLSETAFLSPLTASDNFTLNMVTACPPIETRSPSHLQAMVPVRWEACNAVKGDILRKTM